VVCGNNTAKTFSQHVRSPCEVRHQYTLWWFEGGGNRYQPKEALSRGGIPIAIAAGFTQPEWSSQPGSARLIMGKFLDLLEKENLSCNNVQETEKERRDRRENMREAKQTDMMNIFGQYAYQREAKQTDMMDIIGCRG
jgi:hypothetical protein